jgi:hypothetical protein
MGRGARSVAQRPVPLQSGSAEFSEDRRREIAKTAVRSVLLQDLRELVKR